MDTRFEVESGGITNTELADSDDGSEADIGNQGSQENEETTPDPETNLDNYLLARDRVRRQPKVPSKFSDYELLSFALCIAESLEYSEPSSYKEAMRSPERSKWIAAMKEEIQSLLKNNTWILVDNP